MSLYNNRKSEEKKEEPKVIERVKTLLKERKMELSIQDCLIALGLVAIALVEIIRGRTPWLLSLALIILILCDFLRTRQKLKDAKEAALYMRNNETKATLT